MNTVLEFKDLYRPFDTRSTFVSESGSVEEGHILAVKGASGSGKSTLLRMLARIVNAESGEVYWAGKHWYTIAPETWRRSIHYVSQKPIMFEGTLEDNFKQPFFLREIKKRSAYSQDFCRQLMEDLGLPQELMQQSAHNLSGGEASRAALIRALIIEPTVLLLDEPTAYLDSGSRLQLVNLVSQWVTKKPGRAVVMASHNDEEFDDMNNVSNLIIGQTRGTNHE